MATLRRGSSGAEVRELQASLQQRGFLPGAVDGDFGPGTEAAVKAFQTSEGLLADGVAGPRTLAALNADIAPDPPLAIETVTVAKVAEMFPGTRRANITANLPFVLDALVEANLADKPMILMGLATIRAETAQFLPIDEGQSRWNTSPGGQPFDLYDNRQDLGNQGPPDGDRFKGRGYIQLTGRDNYARIGQKIGLGTDLVESPELANDPAIAARILAAFLKDKEIRIKTALLEDDLRHARRLVNGGSHGLDEFTRTFRRGENLIA